MSRETSTGGSDVRFRDTLWSVVMRAKEGTQRREALDQLIRLYWKPVYFFLRRRGHDVEDAKDFTQAFFTEVVEKDVLKSVSRAKGKFRTFVLATLEHFAAKQVRYRQAQKRGGHLDRIDFDEAERAFAPSREETPELAFQREWMLVVLQESIATLRQEQTDPATFDALAPYLTRGTRHYGELAQRLGLSEQALAQRMFALRRRLRELVTAQLRDGVATDRDLREEIRDISKLL